MDCCKLEQNRKTLPVLQKLIDRKNDLIREISGLLGTGDIEKLNSLRTTYIDVQYQIIEVGKTAS